MWELLAFEYVKTSVDKMNKFRKIKSMQHVLADLYGKIHLVAQHFNFCNFTLWMPLALDARGVAPFSPPMHATEVAPELGFQCGFPKRLGPEGCY